MTQTPVVDQWATITADRPAAETPLVVGTTRPASPVVGTDFRSVDPLYPEPRGASRWIAEQPLAWLGPRRPFGGPRSLGSLVQDGVLGRSEAALLALLVRHRTSLLVIGGRSGAGKSTLLEAFLPWYPAATRQIRLRGSFEDFGWERDPRFAPDRAVLIAEEISGHLPVYLWGAGVGRFLAWRTAGCALAATAHGDQVEDIARLLTGYPLRLPLRSVAAFDLILRLGPVCGTARPGFRLTDVWAAGLTGAGGLITRPMLDVSGLHWDAAADLLARLGGATADLGGATAAIDLEIEATA